MVACNGARDGARRRCGVAGLTGRAAAVQDAIEIPVAVHDSVGDASCASDVTTEGMRVFIHLREDATTCTGVTRIYRAEGGGLVFERELIDI